MSVDEYGAVACLCRTAGCSLSFSLSLLSLIFPLLPPLLLSPCRISSGTEYKCATLLPRRRQVELQASHLICSCTLPGGLIFPGQVVGFLVPPT